MKIRRSVVNKLLLRKFKMSENVTASTATRANTVLFLISTIEKNQLLPWFSFLFVLWIWERFIRTRYSNRAWEETLARAGNPADVLALMGNQLEPHPSNAGDRRIFSTYTHFLTELSIRMNETPRNEAFVDELKFYFFFVFCLVDFFRNLKCPRNI